MCGIFGAVGADVSPDAARRALGTLHHRGPDGTGQWWDAAAGVFFGHTRLSIIDLSAAGAQPMVNEDGTLVLTMNGEIYNHAALRQRLIAQGHVFRSACDAEVILHLFEEQGMALLDELHGMFAFALYETRSQTLYLARDRLGIKPLYYYDHGGCFAFASELKAIRALPGLDLVPDVTAYYDFLTYQFVPAPKTIYRHARKLPPGHYLERRAGRAQVRQYWDVAFHPDESMTEGAALEALDEMLTTTVRDHLVADVPVGIFLSGGVDSALVTAFANRAAAQPLTGFTIAFRDRQDDEAATARAIAAHLGSPHVVEEFAMAELLAGVPMMPALFDEPFADHSALPMIGLSRLAASQMKVVLSGDGGDETHVGYGRYLKGDRRRIVNALSDALPGFTRLVTLPPLRRVPWLRRVAGGTWARSCQYHGGIPRQTKLAVLDIEAPELRDYDDYWLLRQHDRPEFPPLGRQQYLDLKTFLADGILTKVDRTAMRFGLEVRPPLLDHRLVELAARIPERFKCDDGVQKRLLRALLARHLPPELANARKRGFSVPIEHFVRREGMFRLSRDVEVMGAFRLNKKKIDRVLSPAVESQQIWIIAALAEFVSHLERSRALAA